MPPDNNVMVVVAVLGVALTICTILFSAGQIKGAFSARLEDIERRLDNVEQALNRLGFMFSGSDRRNMPRLEK